MILAYIDESGINYSQNKQGYFNDGPYSIWTAVLVNDRKIFDIERSFQDLARKYLGASIKKQELHATNIWESRKESPNTDKRVRQYFEEFAQLVGKLRTPILFGIQQKNPNLQKKTKKNTLEKARELEKARYSLLSLLEHQLAETNETAVLVADKEGSGTEQLKNLVFQRTKWRYSPPGRNFSGIVKPKFLFEYQSSFILDQLHYVDSSDSIIMQFSDNICFVLRKVLEHLYLMKFSKSDGSRPTPDINMLPISEGTFTSFASFCNIQFATYTEKDNDVTLGELLAPSFSVFSFSKVTSGLRTIGISQSNGNDILDSFTPYR